MYEVDLDRFWKDDARSHGQNCFDPAAPQVALGIRMSGECVFAELGVEGNPWLNDTPRDVLIDLHKRYNEKALQIVGKSLLPETFAPEDSKFPESGDFTTVFEARNVIKGGSYWLESDIRTAEDLSAVLDRVEKRLPNLREYLFPANWESEKKRIFETYGIRPSQRRHIRGPVTFAMTYLGVENFIYMMMDEPELVERFRDLLCTTVIECARIYDEEAGYTPETAPHGFSFADDDCCLLNEELYSEFGYPVLEKIFNTFSPDPGDYRYQHSDSAMGHLLPVLAPLNFTGVNFGPTVMFEDIRRHMPNTCVHGCLAPFTFMRNDEEAIIAEVRRDCEAAKGTRGLLLRTAGSINNGSLLTSMRAVMHAIQTYGQY